MTTTAPPALHVTAFATGFGTCAVAWSGQGLARVQLPEADEAATLARIGRGGAKDWRGPPPPVAARAIAALQAYFTGDRTDFADLALDLTGITAFNRQVYAATRAVGWGRTTTYGALAAGLGAPGASRAIGRAMATNPMPVVIPCHRVLAAGGAKGGFSAPGGILTKARLLALEGIALIEEAPLLALMEPGGRR